MVELPRFLRVAYRVVQHYIKIGTGGYAWVPT